VGLDDVMSTESAVVAAATAAVLSPKARNTMRKGAVYGVAGVLKAGDVLTGAARGMARGVRGEETTVSDEAAPPVTPSGRSTGSPAPASVRRTGGAGASSRRAAANKPASA
jgi:hypothetical protein